MTEELAAAPSKSLTPDRGTGPAPADYLKQVVAEIKKLEPDVLIPMHCSGLNFVQEARAQMPDSVLVTTTGSRVTFGA